MDRLNSHFLRPHQLAPRVVSGDGQIALVDKLGVSPSRSRLLNGPHRLSSVEGAIGQGRSAEMAVSPHHNNQCTIFGLPCID
jgi:hypothetical protein